MLGDVLDITPWDRGVTGTQWGRGQGCCQRLYDARGGPQGNNAGAGKPRYGVIPSVGAGRTTGEPLARGRWEKQRRDVLITEYQGPATRQAGVSWTMTTSDVLRAPAAGYGGAHVSHVSTRRFSVRGYCPSFAPQRAGTARRGREAQGHRACAQNFSAFCSTPRSRLSPGSHVLASPSGQATC